MDNSEQKISKFVHAITSYAEHQRDQIHKEIEEYKAERLKTAEEDAITDVYNLMQKEMSDMRAEGVREMSRRDLEARKSILSRRTRIIEEVCQCAEKKINDFIRTSGYLDILRERLKQAASVLPEEGSVYYFAKRDSEYWDQLQEYCPPGSRFDTTNTITLGGVIGVNMTIGKIADNSLDTAVRDQREWLMSKIGGH